MHKSIGEQKKFGASNVLLQNDKFRVISHAMPLGFNFFDLEVAILGNVNGLFCQNATGPTPLMTCILCKYISYLCSATAYIIHSFFSLSVFLMSFIFFLQLLRS